MNSLGILICCIEALVRRQTLGFLFKNRLTCFSWRIEFFRDKYLRAMFLEQLQQLRLHYDKPLFFVVNEFLVGLLGIKNFLVSENLSVIPLPSIVWKMRMRRKLRYIIRRKMSHRFGKEGQVMAWLGLICLFSCRNSGKIETVVSNKLLVV